MATYHVTKTGNDTTGNGSSGSPWVTIQKAVNVAVAGDTVEVHTGVYVESVNCNASGTSTNLITIKAFGSPTTALGPTGFDNVIIRYASGSGIFVNGKAWIKIRGIEVDGANAALTGNFAIRIQPGSSNVTIEYCNVHRGGQNIMGAHSGTHPGAVGSNNITIQNCIIHDNRDVAGASTNHNIYSDTGSNWVIEDNEIYNSTAYCVHLYPETQNSFVRRNRIHNPAMSDSGNGSACVLLSDRGNICENNVMYTSSSSAAMGVRIQFSSNALANSIVRNNTIYNIGQYGIYIAAGATGMQIQNNLVIGSTTPISNNAGAGAVLSNNITSSSASAITTYTVSATDFHLRTGSPAIDAGVAIPALVTDFDGAVRPQGGSWDVGAYEFGGTVIDTTAPATPTGLAVI